MTDYRITFDPAANGFVFESETIVKGSIAVNIPADDKRKRQFISLYLHKADLEEGISFLLCISADKCVQVNQALFMAALSNMMKCFQATSEVSELAEKKFRKAFPLAAEELEQFKNWRNKHFVHDENSMREATAFLWVAPEGCENSLGGLPSVFWNRAPIDFIEEGRRLEVLMKVLLNFVLDEFDKLGKNLIEDYGAKSREELLTYETATVSLATTTHPDKERGIKGR
ncbi:MAG: hypothetical protein IKV99_06425 [Oscillospiraceae bacterium]|nr:hypothetical protein [Oscillospiraceae bacterium]